MAINREKVIRSAEKYVSKGKLEHAINEYRKVLKENPNDANTLNRVGDLYARIEKIDEAVKLFTQIAEQYTSDGFFVKAIAIYKKIIKLDPTVLQVYERLAELYHKQGLLNEARTQYQVLADYYQKHDNATSAINIYQRMVDMEPDNPSYHLKLAELFQSQKLHDKSVAAYRQLADLLMVNGSVEEASQVYLRALDVGHGDLGFVREAVSGLVDGGHAGAAARVLARAVELNPAAAAIESEVGLSSSRPSLDETASESTRSAVVDEAFEIEVEAPVAFGAGSATEDDVFEIDVDADAGPPGDAFEIEVDGGGFDFDSSTFDEIDEPTGSEGPVEVSEARKALRSDTEDEDDSVVFDLSLDDDESASMVRPPADMDSTGSAFLRDEEEAEVEVDWSSPGTDELEVGSEEAPEDRHLDPPSEFEIDLDDVGFDDEGDDEHLDLVPAAVGGVPAVAPEPAGPVHRPEDLLDEARVFAKYGLKEKARDRVGQLLADFPDHPGGLRLRAEMALEEEDHDLAFELGEKLVAAVRGGAEPDEWEALRPRLEAAGFAGGEPTPAGGPDEVVEALEIPPEEEEEEPFDALVDLEPEEDDPESADLDDALEFDPDLDFGIDVEDEPMPVAAGPPAVEAPPVAPPAAPAPVTPPKPPSEVGDDTGSRQRKNRISKLLEDLDLDALGVSKPKKKPKPAAPPTAAPETAVAADAGDVADVPAESPPVVAPPPFPTESPAAPRKKISLVDELGLDELDDELGGVFEDAKARAAGSTESVSTGESRDDLDETGMSWLDEPATGDQPQTGVDAALFDEEDDFFDLASELERELSEDELQDEPEIVQSQEQSLEEIIDGFKKGVAENLSPEDYDTHFNLGIAYREMGLIDEAIGEFQLSSKDARYLVDSSSMLGMCFLEKGLPELALRWYRKGLESPDIEEEKTLGLLYEMGNTYLNMGDDQAAYKTFAEIYGINSGFRDVSSRLEELRSAAT